MYKKVIASIILVMLSGCATKPLQIDLTESIYKAQITPLQKPRISGFTIVNKAGDGTMVNSTLGSDSIFPIKPAITTKETVEEDIKRYLNERIKLDDKSDRSIRVVVYKADSYWVWNSKQKVPIFGLFFVDSDTRFGLNLKVAFEIELNGKVVNTYWFDDKITINGKATTEKKIKESYKKLIAKYRKIFFKDLDSSFINRYL